MIKKMLALGLCVAFLALSYAVAQGEESNYSPSQNSDAQSKVVSDIQEAQSVASLPPTDGVWLIEMSRSGGMRPAKESVQINSEGEINVISEHYEQGRTVVDCSFKGKLSAEDFLKVKKALNSTNRSKWRESYDDPKHPVCCDQPTTHLTLRRREIGEGDGGGDGTVSQTTSWYPGSSELRPRDLATLATIAQTLWNNAREHCTK
jgi:hypothetical protein